MNILFICHGNICRSPMAEFLFIDLLKKKKRLQDFSIASASTSKEATGSGVYPPAKKLLASLHISCNGKISRQVKKSDYDTYDYLIVMETYNIGNLKKIIPNDPEQKIYRLLDFCENPRDIDDPWYTNDFQKTHDDIMEGLEAFLHFIDQKNTIQ